jgi:Retrotransposon gag protein
MDDVTATSVGAEATRITDLERQIAELKHQPSSKPVSRKPDSFTDSRKNRSVQSWIKTMDDYFELNKNSLSTPREILLMAASYLGDSAKRDYNSYVESKGEFESWTDMKKWLNDTYNPVDPINSACCNYFNCKQRNGETLDEFYRRFTDCKNMLDTPLPDTYVTYFFTLHLLLHYQEQIYTDNDFARWDKSLDDIVAKIKRGPPPPAHQGGNLNT